MIRTTKINDTTVKPIRLPKIPKNMVKGGDMFPNIYSNIFILARKGSGKTTVIANILNQCMGKDTRLFIFAATVNKDPTFKAITEKFGKKGNTVLTYTSLMDGKHDNLNEIMEMLRGKDEEEEESEEESEEGMPIIITGERKKRKRKPKPKKPKYIAPEIIFVLDDLSTELRSKSVATLLKSNRHYKCKVLLSSQNYNDLKPESIRQLDYVIAFKGQTLEKLQTLHSVTDLSIPFEEFVQLYYYATDQKFHFLYIDTVEMKFRHNFNEGIEI